VVYSNERSPSCETGISFPNETSRYFPSLSSRSRFFGSAAVQREEAAKQPRARERGRGGRQLLYKAIKARGSRQPLVAYSIRRPPSSLLSLSCLRSFRAPFDTTRRDATRPRHDPPTIACRPKPAQHTQRTADSCVLKVSPCHTSIHSSMDVVRSQRNMARRTSSPSSSSASGRNPPREAPSSSSGGNDDGTTTVQNGNANERDEDDNSADAAAATTTTPPPPGGGSDVGGPRGFRSGLVTTPPGAPVRRRSRSSDDRATAPTTSGSNVRRRRRLLEDHYRVVRSNDDDDIGVVVGADGGDDERNRRQLQDQDQQHNRRGGKDGVGSGTIPGGQVAEGGLVVLPGVPVYDPDWARDWHDFFNLVVLVPVVVLNVMNWNWDLLLNSPSFHNIQKAWTGDWFVPFFAVTALYFFVDLLWILLLPQCVKSPSTIIQHHLATMLYIIIPYTNEQYRWCMGSCMIVEVNTWFLIARRVFNKQGFPPWIIDLSFVSIRVKLISIFFYLTWIGIRCILYPALMPSFYRIWVDHSAKVGSKWNLVMLCIPLHAIFCLLNLKWSYDLLMSKLRYWRRKGHYSKLDVSVSKGL